MKRFCLLALLLAAALPSRAQFAIDEVNARQSVEFRDSVKTTSASAAYFNEAAYRAERAAIRLERNYLEYGASLQGTLTSYNDAWIATSGGDNSVAVVAALHLHHIFTKDHFTIETKLNGKFGYNRMRVEITPAASADDPDPDPYSKGIWFKNQDEIAFSTAPAYKFSKHWSFGSIIKFRTQFANGYVSRTQQDGQDLKSCFMTPGYLDISVGFNYASPFQKFPVKVNLSPLALSATFATSDRIRIDNEFNYGIENPNKRSKWEGGSSIQIDFDRSWGKNDWFRYQTSYFMFYGWISGVGQHKIASRKKYEEQLKSWEETNLSLPVTERNYKDKPMLGIHPVIRWENTFEIKATKYIATQISCQLYYNRAQNYNLQIQTLLSVGFSYTFKNKEKP